MPCPTGSSKAPELRVAGVVVLVVSATTCRNPHVLSALAALVFALCLWGNLPLRHFFRRLAMVLGGSLFFLVLAAWPPESSPAPQGAIGAGTLALRLAVAAGAVAWLQGTLGDRQLFAAFSRLRVPPVLLYQMLITWRYFHVLGEDLLSLWRAAGARGFAKGGGLWDRRTFVTLGHLAGALLVRSAGRAERIALALASRNLNGHPPLVVARSWSWREVASCLAMVGVAALAIWLERGASW